MFDIVRLYHFSILVECHKTVFIDFQMFSYIIRYVRLFHWSSLEEETEEGDEEEVEERRRNNVFFI